MNFAHPQFPNSLTEPFLITSAQTPLYNCIAWAYGVMDRWYWPDDQGIYFWPSDVPRTEEINSFIQLFTNIGYQVCAQGNLENGVQKIAIYLGANGKPSHAARQLPDGSWTSKLGQSFDVMHTLNSMSSGCYGNVAVFMQRQVQQP